MSIMASRPLIRWLVPGTVVAAVFGGGAVATTLSASAQSSLPPRSPAQLLVDVQTARLEGASGTVTEKADLGLPALPTIGGSGDSANLNSLITGSHTLRVWYSGPDKARVALLGALGESDIIRNGTNLWIWSSSNKTAQHQTLPERSTQPRATPSPLPTDLPTTPQQAADRVLAELDPTTNVGVDPTGTVAGRPVYVLVLTPKDTGSRVARVTVAIDGTEHVPLRVQVFAKAYTPPAFEIGFTDVNFTRPDNARFEFTPPPGTKVTEGSQSATPSAPGQTGQDRTGQGQAGQRPKTAVIGTGWTSVVVARLPEGGLPGLPGLTAPAGSPKPSPTGPAAGSQAERSIQSILDVLPRVQGAWGSGRLLTSRLFSVLLTDDGRVLAGAVDREQLLAAAANPAAALK